MKIISIFIFCAIFLFSSLANAHGLYISSKDGQLRAYFSDGHPAAGATVKLVNAEGVIVLQDRMDESGYWQLPDSLDFIPQLIIVEAPGGHRTSITWQAAAMKEGSQGRSGLSGIRIRLITGICALVGIGFIIKWLIKRKP